MTAYDDTEQSIHGAQPVEVYKFIGSNTTYFYTSADVNVTVNSELYQAIPITRKSLQVGTQDDDTLVLEITMPYSEQLIRDFAFTNSPPTLNLEIRRTHWGLNFATDWVMLWKGPVTSFSVDGKEGSVRTSSVFTGALNQPVPSRCWQTPCNHVLYDTRCTINPAGFTFTKTVLEVLPNDDVRISSSSGITDGELSAGEIINSRTNERRLIHTNTGQDIFINFPFFDIKPGDTVTLRAGCDHSLATCKNKFNNVINFGGHPNIPGENPFIGRL